MAERASGRHYPALESPDPAVNQAVGWAIRRVGGHLRVDPARSLGSEADGEEVAGIVADARKWHRVRAPGMLDPAEFLGRVVGLLLGARLDGVGGRLDLVPALPVEWRSLVVRRLRAHRSLLDLEIRPRAEWVTVRVSLRYGPALAVSVRLPAADRVTRVTVDEIPLEGPQAVFTVLGEHEVTLWTAERRRDGEAAGR